MNRRIFLIAAALIAAGMIVYTHAEDAARAPAPLACFTPADGIEYWRTVQFPTVRFSGVPLESALDQFRDATHANVVVDWPALEAAGIHRTTPIRLRLYNVSALKALELIVAEAHEPDTTIRPEYHADDEGVIHIAMSTEQGGAVIRMYDVRDLIDRLFDPQGKASEEASRDPTVVQTRTDMLIRLVTDTVEPDSWRDAGGAVGTVRVFAGHLLVGQTPLNHRKIECLLYNLRRITEARARGESPTTRGVDLLAPPTTQPTRR